MEKTSFMLGREEDIMYVQDLTDAGGGTSSSSSGGTLQWVGSVRGGETHPLRSRYGTMYWV